MVKRSSPFIVEEGSKEDSKESLNVLIDANAKEKSLSNKNV